jgi:hypothetical protein
MQAVGSLVGLGVAIWVPFRIQDREQKARQKERSSYRVLLLDAFEALQTPIEFLEQASMPESGEADPHETADQMANSIESMNDILAVVSKFEDVTRLDQFTAVLKILSLRRKLEDAKPTFEKEYNWLSDHPESEAVLRSAIGTLGAEAAELRPLIDEVVSVLGEGDDRFNPIAGR